MAFSKTKNTKRFHFGLNRDIKSHKAGANTFTIGTRQSSDAYLTSSSYITMTVKEAKALQGFLNQHLATKSS